MSVMRLDDPRIFDWSQKAQPGAALRRAAGALHHRLHLRALAARKLGSQRRRDRIHAAAPPGRDLDQRRRLQRRRRDLQPQPLVREPRAEQLDGDAHGGARSRRRARRRSRATSPRRTAPSSRRSRPARSSAPATARSRRSTTSPSSCTCRRPTSPSSRTSADYPALIVHRGFDEAGGDLTAAPVGTGPWELVSHRGRRAGRLPAAHQRRLVGRRRRGHRAGLPRRRRVHRLRHRPLGRRSPPSRPARSTPATRRRRATSRSSTRSGSRSRRR